jgi:hypothetical protein
MLAAIAKPGLSFALTLGLFAGVEWALRQGLLSSSFGAAIGAQVTTELTRTTTVQMPWWWYAIFVLSGIVMSVWTSSAVSRELLVERYGFGVKSVRFRRVLKRILGLAD